MIDAILCYFGRCRSCITAEDETGTWGECTRCHKRHGFVSRDDLEATSIEEGQFDE